MPIRKGPPAPPVVAPRPPAGADEPASVQSVQSGPSRARVEAKPQATHEPLAVALQPIAKSDAVLAAETRASAFEQRAVRTTDPTEKRALTRAALEAWMSAADGDTSLGAARLHGAQTNAARAAERLGALAPDDATRHLCAGVAHALEGDLARAAASFTAGLASSGTRATRTTRSALRAALHRIDDGRAGQALDDLARKLVSARTDLDPRASAARLLGDARALVDAHPRQALAFAALALEAASAAGAPNAPGLDAAQTSDAVALVKHAAHLQSGVRVPSVATKALLLAHVQRLAGNLTGASAAYRRVGEMASASEREIDAARLACVQVAFARGRPLDVTPELAALAAKGPLERGLVALATAHVLPKALAVAALDDALASLDGAPAGARHVDDAADLTRALVVQRRALTRAGPPAPGATAPGASLPHGAARTLEALGALELAGAAHVPLATLLDAKLGAGRGASLNQALPGPGGALVALTASRLGLLDPVPVAVGADHATLGGLLAHVVTGQRGDASRSHRTPLALSLGVDVARAALSVRSPAHADITAGRHEAQLGAAPSAARTQQLVAEVSSALASPAAGAPTNGPVDVDEARRRLVALGWQAQAGSTSLTKDGARVAFDTFSIAQTASFHATLLTSEGAQGRSVHVGKLVFTEAEWSIFERGFEETMARYQRALHTKQGARFEARDIDDIRTLVSLGRDVEEMPARRAQIAELAQRAAAVKEALGELVKSGKAPKGAMIFVEGIDAASKTTNGMNLKRLFEDAGFTGSWLSFKAPTAEERQQHWLARYQAQAPQENGVFLADRTFLGDHAYNPGSTDEAMRGMAKDVAAWEQELAARGVLVVKLLFDPRLEDNAPVESADDVLERPMLTFGKREARALIARDLLERAAGDVAGLEAACMGPGYNDLKSFHEGTAAMERFRAFADANDAAGDAKWVRVGTKERHAGRLHAYDALLAELARRTG